MNTEICCHGDCNQGRLCPREASISEKQRVVAIALICVCYVVSVVSAVAYVVVQAADAFL